MINIGKMIDELFLKLKIFLIYFTKLKELIYNLLFKSNSRCGPIKKSPLNWFYDGKSSFMTRQLKTNKKNKNKNKKSILFIVIG